nr:phage tail protein [Burkholderia sp. WP9]
MSKVSAHKRKTELVEHREDDDSSTNRSSPGLTGFEALTLERGVTHDPEFEACAAKVWHTKSRSPAFWITQYHLSGLSSSMRLTAWLPIALIVWLENIVGHMSSPVETAPDDRCRARAPRYIP